MRASGRVMSRKSSFATTVFIFVYVFCAAISSHAQTLTTLHSFSGSDGINPYREALVQGADGSLAIVRSTKTEPGKVRRMPSSELQKPSPNHDPFIEMYWSPTVLVRGPFAQVWAPYVLRDNGAVVH